MKQVNPSHSYCSATSMCYFPVVLILLCSFDTSCHIVNLYTIHPSPNPLTTGPCVAVGGWVVVSALPEAQHTLRSVFTHCHDQLRVFEEYESVNIFV